tara:strand:+ start:23667 stop:25844 length:2178 start_codon:yes stop_codon:yes gene_type:complete
MKLLKAIFLLTFFSCQEPPIAIVDGPTTPSSPKNTPVQYVSTAEDFMTFDFQNGEVEAGFEDWYYSDKGSNCGVYNGEAQSKLCNPDGRKAYLYYNHYNTDHMGWLRYGFLDASKKYFTSGGSSLKIQLTGGAHKGPNSTVAYSGISTKSKSDMLGQDIKSVDDLFMRGDIAIYFKTKDSYGRFPQLKNKNRFYVWVLLPYKSTDIERHSKAYMSRPGNTVSWYPFINRSTGGHYYHHSGNIAMGGWTRIQFDAHPNHHNSGSPSGHAGFYNGGYEYPNDGLKYFENMATFAVRAGFNGVPINSPVYFDEFQVDYVPYENEETISNLGIGYNPENKQFDISFNDKYRCLECNATYEVRYSFGPITNANYKDAKIPKLVTNFNRGKNNSDGVIYKPNPGYNLIWAALDVQDQDKTKLKQGSRIFFAVKDISTRTGFTPHEEDSALVEVPGLGKIRKMDLVKTIPYIIQKVVHPLKFKTQELDEAIVGQAIDQKIEIYGGVPPYNFSVEGQLPQGLSLSSDGQLSGTPTFKSNNTFQMVITDSAGSILKKSFSHEVSAPEDFDVPKCGLIVDFKESSAASNIEDSRFNSIFKDTYTGYVEKGTTNVVGSNPDYNHQGVKGSGYTLQPGDQVRMTWLNVSSDTRYEFSPRLSFTIEGRASGASAWKLGSSIDLRPGQRGVSTYTVAETVNSNLINVNVNKSNHKALVMDRIEFVEQSRSESEICQRPF